jgi:hypothetical protein
VKKAGEKKAAVTMMVAVAEMMVAVGVMKAAVQEGAVPEAPAMVGTAAGWSRKALTRIPILSPIGMDPGRAVVVKKAAAQMVAAAKIERSPP